MKKQNKVKNVLLQNVNAYVVGDHYTAPWELPATKKYVDKDFTYLQALQAVLKEQGKCQVLCHKKLLGHACSSQPHVQL